MLLHFIDTGNLEIVKYLVESGADILADNNRAVRWAVRSGYLEVVKYLVESGADAKWALNWIKKEGAGSTWEVVSYLEGVTNEKSR
jgi:ankyrin repeat protein